MVGTPIEARREVTLTIEPPPRAVSSRATRVSMR
jgi:hypothetical protein